MKKGVVALAALIVVAVLFFAGKMWKTSHERPDEAGI